MQLAEDWDCSTYEIEMQALGEYLLGIEPDGLATPDREWLSRRVEKFDWEMSYRQEQKAKAEPVTE